MRQHITAFLTDITSAQEPAAVVETAMSNISSYASAIVSDFEALTSKVHNVRVRIQVETGGEGADWFSQQLQATTRNAGGIVPGMLPGA